nr:hypothetical protein [Tanacetum cinerariifolium]
PGVKFCAGEGGLKSWEWCGGGGVGWKVGESGVKGMAGKPGSGATLQWCVFELGEGGGGEGESWVSDVGGWKVGSWWESGRRENLLEGMNNTKEPMKILKREFKKLKRSRIDIVKVRLLSICVIIESDEYAYPVIV